MLWCQNLKNLAIWLAKSVFVYNLRKGVFLILWFLQIHKDNYGTSCKAKNSISLEIFYKLQKELLLGYFKVFLQNNFFSRLCHYFILKTPKLYMKFHKNPFSCFWKNWFWLTDWLADNGSFIRPFLPKNKSLPISTN